MCKRLQDGASKPLNKIELLNDQSCLRKVIRYVVNRQNVDGGYTFCQGAESNAQDTYYGLSILSILKQSLPNPEKTLEFLNESRLDSINSTYSVTKALLLLGKEGNERLKKRLHSILNSTNYFGSAEVFLEASSEFTSTFMVLELANLVGVEMSSEEIVKWILQFRNKDGGFGPQGISNISSTYYAGASMKLLNGELENLRAATKFIRSCEKPYGGFTIVPINFMPYVEYTYYGVMTLALIGETCKYPEQTKNYLLSCQNLNGGFARSDLGISTFENTFQAVSVLKKIGYF